MSELARVCVSVVRACERVCVRPCVRVWAGGSLIPGMTHSLEATGRQAGTQAGAHPSPAAPPQPPHLCAPRESYHVEARQFSSLANRICQVYCAATVVSVYESNMRARSPVKVGRGGGARQSWLGGGGRLHAAPASPCPPHRTCHTMCLPCRAVHHSHVPAHTHGGHSPPRAPLHLPRSTPCTWSCSLAPACAPAQKRAVPCPALQSAATSRAQKKLDERLARNY